MSESVVARKGSRSASEAPADVVAGGTTLDLISIMHALYESEINCRVESFWDGGFTIYLGDDMNGLQWVATVDNGTLRAAGVPLAIAALKAYPTSGFADWLGFGGDKVKEQIGWLGVKGSTINHFQCEFCGQEHLDCTLIEHTDDYPVLACRAAVTKAEGLASVSPAREAGRTPPPSKDPNT